MPRIALNFMVNHGSRTITIDTDNPVQTFGTFHNALKALALNSAEKQFITSCCDEKAFIEPFKTIFQHKRELGAKLFASLNFFMRKINAE